MTNSAPALEGVVSRLHEARRRLVAQGIVGVVLSAAATGVLGFAVLELLRRLGWFVAEDMQTLALAGTLAAGVVLLGGVTLAILGAAPIELLARRADRTFGLHERISTALEIAQHGATGPSAVTDAMIADAIQQGRAIDPAALAASRVPRGALLVPLAALAAAAVLLVPLPAVPATNPIEARLSAALEDAERTSVAEDIRRVADAIEDEATRRDDAYMQAVAATLDALGERLETGPETTRGALLDELGTLLDYATAAGVAWGDPSGQRIPELVGALQESIALKTIAQPPAARSSAEVAADAAAPAIDPGATDDPPAPPSATTIETILEEVAAENELARAADAGQTATSSEVLDYIKAAQAQATSQKSDAPQQNTEQQLLGAQADAGAAEEQLVGDGYEPIPNAPVAQPVNLQTTSEMVVTGLDTGEGRSITIEIAPDAKLTTITPETLTTSTEGWRRTTEAEAAREAIGIDDRDTVSRYLSALLGPAAK